VEENGGVEGGTAVERGVRQCTIHIELVNASIGMPSMTKYSSMVFTRALSNLMSWMGFSTAITESMRRTALQEARGHQKLPSLAGSKESTNAAERAVSSIDALDGVGCVVGVVKRLEVPVCDGE
jgi:hypothetical protein